MSIPSWDQYFMSMAIMAATRSKDVQTQFGTVLVKNKKIIGTGYNSFPRDMPDDTLPNTRPDKYPWVIHSEVNALYNVIDDPYGAICYTNGHPCLECLKALYQNGITDYVILNQRAVMTKKYSEYESKVYRQLIEYGNINIKRITIDQSTFQKALQILQKSL